VGTATRDLELVVLDVNETLFALTPVARRMGEVGIDGHLDVWFARVLRDGLAAASAGRFVPFAALARHHLGVLLGASVEDVETAVDHVLAGFDEVAPHPDVEPGLRLLHEAGVAAVALTNGSAGITEAFLERHGLTPFVAGVHDVGEVERWKPAPEPYEHVLHRYGVSPARAVMVAVHPWDLFGAANVGLRTAWIDRRGEAYPAVFGAPSVQGAGLDAVVRSLLASAID
jgi:2-haloacid dehalogenase